MKWNKTWLAALPSFLASGLAALPVLTCPLCWPLYAGLLSSLGLGFVNYTAYLLPVTSILLFAALLPLTWRARQRHGYRPLALGLAGASLLLIGKFLISWGVASLAGGALLVGASLWNIWPRSAESGACPIPPSY